MNTTVSQLRKDGAKVRVAHKRYRFNHEMTEDLYFSNELTGPERHPKGGETIVQVSLSDGRNVEGIAKCSLHDSYNRKVGVSIALGRALKNL